MKKLSLLVLIFLIGCKTSHVSKIDEKYLLINDSKNKFFLTDFIKTHQLKNELGLEPMIIINSEIIYCWDRENYKKTITIKKDEIKKIDIIILEKSIKLYGRSGKYGTIMISTY